MIRLAAMLHMTIQQVEQIGSDELEEWLAYERLYGIPDIYFLTAQVCTTLEMCMTTKKKFHPGDHVPYFKEDDVEHSPSDLLAKLISVTKANET
jgi:hypothetical protein